MHCISNAKNFNKIKSDNLMFNYIKYKLFCFMSKKEWLLTESKFITLYFIEILKA